MPNVLITGAGGQLGSELAALVQESTLINEGYCFYFPDKSEVDVTVVDSINSFIENNNIDIIVNCAAYTAVDQAESERDLANEVNHIAVRGLAEISKSRELKCIHVSTDYVFDGMNFKPYTETDNPNPKSVYGKTKLDGERALQEVNPKNSMIIRTSWLYSSLGGNFVKTMLRLAKETREINVVYDQVGTPTYAKNLAKAILKILPELQTEDVLLYHYTDEGVCSWYDFAKAIFEYIDIDCKVNAIKTQAYPTPAKRPHYSVLDTSAIKKRYNIEIPYWRDSLKDCLKEIGEMIS